MDILNSMINTGPSVFYDPAFRNMIEDHLSYLRARADNDVITVEPLVAYKYAGDFFGLMMHHGVLPQHHWIVMRVNDLISPQDYKDTTLFFIKPKEAVITGLQSTFMSQNKLRK